MSIEFKKKFSIVFACYVLMTSLHLPLFKVYADEKTSIQKVYTDLRKEFDYDEKTDTYYFPQVDVDRLPDKQGRSATVAVSGAVISSVLTLAVKAGLDFASTNSMSEFVSRFFMLDGIGSVVDGMNDVVKKSVGGVLNFSRSLLDTIGSKFSQLMAKDKVSSIYINGRKYPVVPGASLEKTEARYVFESSTLPKTKVDLSEITVDDKLNKGHQVYDSSIELPTNLGTGTFSVEFFMKRSSTPHYDMAKVNIKKSDGSYFRVDNDYAIDFPKDTFSQPGYIAYCMPYFHSYYRGEYSLGFIVAIYSSLTGYLEDIDCEIVTNIWVSDSNVGSKSSLPTVSSSWSSGSIPSNSDDDTLKVSVPKNTNVLVNKKPADIDVPTYETWSPGVTVVPPTIDTGTDSPPVDDVLPPITDDIPGDDTTTTPPGEDSIPSLNFDWLKELFNKLLELIQSIIDWLTNFWDNLLEFIKSIFVPSEGYFIDVFNDILSSIKEKIPGVDVSKLEQLAVGEQEFEDIYATFFGVKCLVVKGSIINRVVSWGRPIIQGIIALFLLLYNYNQIYFLFRGSRLSSNSSEKG